MSESQLNCHWSISAGYSYPATTHNMHWGDADHTCKMYTPEGYVTILPMLHKDGVGSETFIQSFSFFFFLNNGYILNYVKNFLLDFI